MYRFPVKVEQRGESFVVFVPAVPGCVAGGRSREEALRNAREALQAILARVGPGFAPTVGASPPPSDGTHGEYVEVAVSAVPQC